MPSSPLRYDKFSYAVKRKPEKETPPGVGTVKSPNQQQRAGGLAPLALTRDGFAIAEDGSLMSRVVSPPRWTPGTGPVVFASTAPTTCVPSTPSRSFMTAPPCSPASVLKPGSSAASKHADPWAALLHAVHGKLSEDEVVMLSWDTVSDLLEHFGIVNPIDVGRVQLTWRRKQDLALGNDVLSDVATHGDAGSNAATPVDESHFHGRSPDDSVLVYAPPTTQALEQRPIMQIAYGRPASPRPKSGKRYVPDHKQPLNWSAKPKVDTGRHRPAAMGGASPNNSNLNQSRSSSRLEQ